MGSFFYFSGLPEVIIDFSKSQLFDTYLVLIGGGEQDEQLRALAKTQKVEERVIFTGFINFQELPGYLSMADIAINPMVQSQVANLALPNKVLQYLAAGLPVVTFQLSGLESSLQGLASLTVAEPAKGIWSSVEDLVSSMPHSGQVHGASKGFARAFSIEETLKAFENLIIRIVKSPHE
jgi:glycosyltransferase involved in cell wall biosynthesis